MIIYSVCTSYYMLQLLTAVWLFGVSWLLGPKYEQQSYIVVEVSSTANIGVTGGGGEGAERRVGLWDFSTQSQVMGELRTKSPCNVNKLTLERDSHCLLHWLSFNIRIWFLRDVQNWMCQWLKASRMQQCVTLHNFSTQIWSGLTYLYADLTLQIVLNHQHYV